MDRMTRRLFLMLLLIVGAADIIAQSSVKHGRQKSLMGIEVHFRWDNSRLDLGYMGNERTFERFAEVIDSIGLHMIDSVVIVSQSSPEGTYEHNRRLSQRRAATMRRAIESRHPELVGRLHVHPDGESWQRLREYVVNDTQMKQSTIEQVLRVIDADVNIGTKKWRMEQLPVYRYLYRTYYPRIRNSVFCIIYFDIPAPVAGIEEPKYWVELPVFLEESVPIQHTPKEPALSIKTNLLADAFFVPGWSWAPVLNVALEWYPRHSSWTVMGEYSFPWWDRDPTHHYLQMLNWHLEARHYYTYTHRHVGWYAAPYVHYNLYDFSFNAEDAWQGEGVGAGLSVGYTTYLDNSRRWKIECFLRMGYYETRYDPYHAGDPYKGKYYYDWEGDVEDFIRRNHRLRWFGPTGVGISVSYDLLYRPERRGMPMSFKDYFTP